MEPKLYEFVVEADEVEVIKASTIRIQPNGELALLQGDKVVVMWAPGVWRVIRMVME